MYSSTLFNNSCVEFGHKNVYAMCSIALFLYVVILVVWFTYFPQSMCQLKVTPFHCSYDAVLLLL